MTGRQRCAPSWSSAKSRSKATRGRTVTVPRTRPGKGTETSSMSMRRLLPSHCIALGPMMNSVALRAMLARGRSVIVQTLRSGR